MPIKTLLLDIEGTTSPISFTYELLFPYARDRLGPFLADHRDQEEVRNAVQELRNAHRADVQDGAPELQDGAGQGFTEGLSVYCRWLMSQDRKSTPLKVIQGLIWEQGFICGDLCGQVFADVPPAFQRWQHQNRDIAIYSSGSVLAQKLLFRHSERGDLTRYISSFFDTRIGPKREAASYRRILAELRRRADEVLFVSDVSEELDAAREAGLRTALAVRGHDVVASHDLSHPIISTFNDVTVD